MCDPRDGQWRLSKEYYIEGVSTVHNDHPLVNICWGHSGAELAIVDVYGQISQLCQTLYFGPGRQFKRGDWPDVGVQ